MPVDGLPAWTAAIFARNPDEIGPALPL